MRQSWFATYLSSDEGLNKVPLESELVKSLERETSCGDMNRGEWLGRAEQAVFTVLRDLAPYTSTFSIKNPRGWRYWLIHLSVKARARQAFNDVLHKNEAQAHFGRAGLNMLSFDPRFEGQYYLFNEDARSIAREALYEDIPQYLYDGPKELTVNDFYSQTYNHTPAHSEDINEVLFRSSEVEIFTGPDGGKRQKPQTIKSSDIIRLKPQRFLSLPMD